VIGLLVLDDGRPCATEGPPNQGCSLNPAAPTAGHWGAEAEEQLQVA